MLYEMARDWLNQNGGSVTVELSTTSGNYLGTWSGNGDYTAATHGVTEEVLYFRLYQIVKTALLDHCDLPYDEFCDIEYD